MDINEQDVNGSTKLHIACEMNNLEKAKYYVEKGADLNIKDYEGWPPLFTAILYGSLDVAKYLFELVPDKETKDNEFGCTVLHASILARKNKMFFLKHFLENGLSINIVDNEGRTSLYVAASYQEVTLVQFLVDQGADQTIKGLGETPLEFSSRHMKEFKRRLDEDKDIDEEMVKGQYYRFKQIVYLLSNEKTK